MENNNRTLDELKKRFGNTAFKNKDRTIDEALMLAYADMSRRAQGHTKDSKDKSIDYLKLAFQKVKNGEIKLDSQGDFDDWHKDICDGLMSTIQSGTFEGTYGRAQKVLNMAFKYLMYTDYANYLSFNYCHMTLDSYTLAWYKSVSDKKKTYTWSKIQDYDEYLEIQKEIRSKLASGNNREYSIVIDELGKTETVSLPPQPIFAEFIIWEGEKLLEKYKGLVGSINTYKERGKEEDSWLIGDRFSDFLKKAIQ